MENSITIDLPSCEVQDSNLNLYLNSFGHSVTAPCHRYGPAVRSYYLIHYILEGEGEFMVNNIRYHLTKGQGFLIEPDYQTTYTSDAENPWTYIWVGFSGKAAGSIVDTLGLSQGNPIFSCDEGEKLKKYVLEIIRHNHSNPSDTYRALGTFFLFISTLAESQKNQTPTTDGNSYIQHAITYIHRHINEPILVEDVADYVGLNRSYLSVLFKTHTGMTPIKYIQNCRITKARHLLESSKLSVESIAYSCGYQKPESLMKFFRRTYGCSPTAYRKQVIQNTKEMSLNISKDIYSSVMGEMPFDDDNM
ncbi:MAG: AraC family transcriptional regulator [Lachnospiraceae bacterium]|nr:AraC family transcriptional regulator [Lachnospiraceae bacterium]